MLPCSGNVIRLAGLSGAWAGLAVAVFGVGAGPDAPGCGMTGAGSCRPRGEGGARFRSSWLPGDLGRPSDETF